MKRFSFPSALFVALTVFGLLGCSPIKRGEYAQGSGTIYCDDGFRNVLEEEIQVFEYSYPESSVIPFYVSETEAIDTLLADKTDAIIVTRELTPAQVEYMKDKFKRIVRQRCIAVDAVALIVNKENPVSQLSLGDVQAIMRGEISRWNQLAVPDTAVVRLVFDNPGSSTVSYMRERFLPKGKNLSDNPYAFAQKSNAQVFDIVKKDRNAIGIISVSWLGDYLEAARKVPVKERMEDYSQENDTVANTLTTEVKVLKLSNPCEANDFSNEGYKPYQAYINSGEYPLFRKVYMISTATKSSVINSFYMFMTGYVGQKIISKTGILPYHISPRVVQLR